MIFKMGISSIPAQDEQEWIGLVPMAAGDVSEQAKQRTLRDAVRAPVAINSQTQAPRINSRHARYGRSPRQSTFFIA